MKLAIYRSKRISIDETILEEFESIAKRIEHNYYGSFCGLIEILPCFVTEEDISNGKWKEMVSVSTFANAVTVSKRIGYDLYINGSENTQRELLLECIIAAIKDAKKRLGSQFQAKQYLADFEVLYHQKTNKE